MRFEIVYQPIDRIDGVGPETTTCDDVKEAWRLVEDLQMSDERVEITENGRPLDWLALRERATRT